MGDEEARTVWVGNIDSEKVTQEMLYELFMQAGPLHYVKIPRDKASGKNKSFAFVCFRHSVSVPYAIELMNGILLYGRSMRVQSRHHQDLQQQGLANGPGGIHSLDPEFGHVRTPHGPPQQCGQQGLMQTPNLLGSPVNQFPNHILAMAQLLNAHQPIPLSVNPHLNAHRERRSDRYGSLNYDRGNFHPRDNYNNRKSQDYQNNSHNSHSARNTKDNMSPVQHRQGGFDYSRLGSSVRDYRNPSNSSHHHRSHTDGHYQDRNTDSHHHYDRHYDGHHHHHSGRRNSDGHYDRRGTSRHDPYNRNYRH